MDDYAETPIQLLAFNQCNAKEKFADWLRSGGTLLKNQNIGCGINTLSMLGVFSRKDGEEMVSELASDPQRRGTSFFEIMQYVFHRNGRNYPMNELTGYIDTPSRLRHFFQWLYIKMGVDTCIIVKFNRDLQPDVLGHTVLIHKDVTGSMTIYDPQAEREIPLVADTTPLFNTWIHNNGFNTASVILYRDTDIEPDQMPLPSTKNSKSKRRYMRVPLYRRNPQKNPETTSRYRNLKPLSPSEPMDVDEIEPIPFHELSKTGQNRIKLHSPTEAPLIIPDFSERSVNEIFESNVIFMTLPGNSNVVRRRHLLPSPPVSFPVDEKSFKTWKQQVCTTDSGCTEHALSILKLIPDDVYAEMIRWQNIMATGSNPDKVIEAIRESGRSKPYGTIRAAQIDAGSKESIEYAFQYIPPNHGTLVMITYAKPQITDTKPPIIGHSVIFAKNAANTPVIYDGTLHSQYVGMDEIMQYLNKYDLLGYLVIPVYPSYIIHRGTKRNSVAVRRGTTTDARSTKRARIPISYRKPGSNASAKTKRAYEANRLRLLGDIKAVDFKKLSNKKPPSKILLNKKIPGSNASAATKRTHEINYRRSKI